MRYGIAAANRVLFINLHGTKWLPAIPDVDERLRSHPPHEWPTWVADRGRRR
jgi:hypothetical protein